MTERHHPSQEPAGPCWHAMPAGDAVRALDVDPRTGLTDAEASRRLAEHGPNALDEAPREPRWRAFLREFQDLLIVILLIAALVSLLASREWETPVAIVVVVLLNATIGFVQESRAEASLDALRKMTVIPATVRRDGGTVRLDSAGLVAGDIVVVEAGDWVPADGRLLTSTSLEVQESSLTGESAPVAKAATRLVGPQAPLAERLDMLFMNTAVTRGRGEYVVTATGMATEIGHIAHMLHETKPEPTPLQRQISHLSKTLAVIAVCVIAVVMTLGLLRGQGFADVFVTAVSLAVAAIPEGLPAVVAFTLAMGTTRLARRGAIVKRLASVETLGGTTQICTDKTGTLTMNQMTARELLLAGRRFSVSGEGYSTEGKIRTTDGSALPTTLDDVLLAMALCTDASLSDGEVIGDPTDGALIVLAEKGGFDVTSIRGERPRMHEIPFDSDQKFMATFHGWTNDRSEDVVRSFVKGAPDVLAGRADRYLGGDQILPFDDGARGRYDDANARLARQGMRVIAIGAEDFPSSQFQPPGQEAFNLDRIVLLGLVGIADPPRPEARAAIAECHHAGIRVRMITGDHVVTAGAIAAELGIAGEAVTGADLDAVPDDELGGWLDKVGVVARVSPAHKLRIVRALQGRGNTVAMTGDGVNDAPALRQADIGVAMGRTGTEVTKEAATIVLTDDNFATIVNAVEEGRGIYDNIVKFTRFQVATALAFVLTFLVASLADIADGAPFTALQILFVNLVMDGPPAMSLGVDPVSHDAMKRPPRAPHERILNRNRLLRALLTSSVMAAGTLAVLVWAPGNDPRVNEATVAGTMGFVTFVFFQAFNLLNVRSDTRSVFSRETLENHSAFVATAVVVLMLALVVEMDALDEFFTTTDLSSRQWLACAAVGSSILVVGECFKAVVRRLDRSRAAT